MFHISTANMIVNLFFFLLWMNFTDDVNGKNISLSSEPSNSYEIFRLKYELNHVNDFKKYKDYSSQASQDKIDQELHSETSSFL